MSRRCSRTRSRCSRSTSTRRARSRRRWKRKRSSRRYARRVPFDLTAYLARIGVDTAARPTLETLDALVWGHLTHVPFENLDILLDRGIAIDLDSVFAKLVTARRGGYCFEHNTLLAAALREVGF